MKKLFALMLALMLAVAGVSAASAETAAEPGSAVGSSGTIHLKINLNADGITALTGGANETLAKQAAMIVELVNALGITMTSDGKDAELIISANDQPIAGLGVIKSEDKMLLVSELFPNYALAVDAKAMSGMMSGMMSGAEGGTTGGIPGGFTMPQISMTDEQAAALMAPLTKLAGDLQAKIGEPEAAEETMYGATFTAKTPINLTTRELLEMVLPAVKEVVSQEGFVSIMEQLKAQGMNISFSAENIDTKIEELKNTKDEELPAMNAAIYSNEAGDSMFALKMTKAEQIVTVNAGSVAGETVTEVDVSPQFHLLLNIAKGKAKLCLQITPQEGMLLDIDGDVEYSAEAIKAVVAVKMNDAELGNLTIDGTPGGVLSGNYTAEGKTEIAVTDLQDPTNKAGDEFRKNMQSGLMMVMMKAAQAIPAFANLMQQMTPQTEAQPQE